MTLPGLGRIFQLAYVVDDIHAAAATWAKHFAVGPFVLLERIRFRECLVNGAPSDPVVSLAFADRGETQIELIQAHDAQASVFSRATASWRGLHHVGIRTEDIGRDERRLAEAGMVPVQRSLSSSGTATLFMDGPWGIVELIQSADGGAFARRVRAAADAWDGASPYA
jgi:hypothetical protein